MQTLLLGLFFFQPEMALWREFSEVFILMLCCCQQALSFKYLSLNGEWMATNSNNSIHIKGNVPGGIYTDLQHAGIIGDPYYRFNDIEYRWISKDNWNYSKSFSVDSNFLESKRITLICKGLDTVGTIFINDRTIGTSSDMFLQYAFDVKEHVKAGQNTITIAFRSAVVYAEKAYEVHLQTKYLVPPICPPPVQNGECHVNFIRKIQSEFSWDWGPAFPSVGIWKDIGIEARDNAALRDVMVSTVKDDQDVWKLNLRIFVELVDNSEVTGDLVITLGSVKLFSGTVKLVPDEQRIAETGLSVQLPQEVDVELWWPNGAGKQSLYNLTLALATGETSVKSLNIGFRTVELVQDPIFNSGNNSGATFYFKINGKSIFMRGSNWIPADSFPERVTPQYTRRLLLSAREANMNVLRVWGGGMYETDMFYQIADELGIMIWQDFMFACSMYPTVPAFLDNVKTEITQQVKRLQHHASILIWSGNNENEAALVQNWYLTDKHFQLYKSDYLKLYADTIQPLVDSLDASRPFILSSPSNGMDTEREGGVATDPQSNYFGDVHYYNYLANTWNWTIYPTARFVSEYGIQSWTSFETLAKVSIAEDWNANSKFVQKRQHHPLGNMELLASVSRHFGLSRFCNNKNKRENSCDNSVAFKNFIYLTQVSQAMAIKTESEHYLRSQSSLVNGQGFTMGALYWQLNDIWQCPSWASVEYGGKWKMLHYYAKNFFAPLVASPYEDSGNFKVSVISDASIENVNATLTIAVYQWKNFNPIYTIDMSFTQKPTFARIVYENNIDDLLQKAGCPGRPYCFLYVTLKQPDGNEVMSSNFHFLTEFQTVKGLTPPNIKVTVTNATCDDHLPECSFDIILTSEAVAVFVWLEAEGIGGRFSDNGFLVVAPTTQLKFYSWERVTVSSLSSKLSLQSLADLY